MLRVYNATEMFEINIKSTGKTFSVEGGETILEAALRNDIQLPFGCLTGGCGSCKGKVIEGEVDHGDSKAFALSESDRGQGMALFCQARPQSNLAVDTLNGYQQKNPAKKLPSRVSSINKISSDVISLELKTPPTQNFEFIPGQYIDVLLDNGKRRSYSMANTPDGSHTIQLHIRAIKDGLFTDFVMNTLREKDILRLEGPLGDFSFDRSTDKPAIFLASGTGFAPIKSIIEDQLKQDCSRELTLYWGGRRPQDLYMNLLAEQWSRENSHFKYVPVVSQPRVDDLWKGKTGNVHKAVMEDFKSLADVQIYACGAPAMVEAAQKDFVQYRELPEEEFFSDAFTPAPQ